MTKSVNLFQWPVRVYFEDVDSGGIVYYANYLKFMERARTEWLRADGLDVAELVEKDRILFVVKSLEMEYSHPARLSDLLSVSIVLEEIGRASLDLFQEITYDKRILCSGSLRLACLYADTLRPRRIPDEIIRSLKSNIL